MGSGRYKGGGGGTVTIGASEDPRSTGLAADPGTIAVQSDGSHAFIKVGTTNWQWALLGAGARGGFPGGYRARMLARATEFLDDVNLWNFYDDFYNTSNWTVSNASGGTANIINDVTDPTTAFGGCVRVSSGSTAGGQSRVHIGVGSNSPAVIQYNSANAMWYMAAVIRPRTTITANTRAWFGCGRVQVGVLGDISTTKWSVRIDGGRATLQSNPNIDSTRWTVVEVWYNGWDLNIATDFGTAATTAIGSLFPFSANDSAPEIRVNNNSAAETHTLDVQCVCYIGETGD